MPRLNGIQTPEEQVRALGLAVQRFWRWSGGPRAGSRVAVLVRHGRLSQQVWFRPFKQKGVHSCEGIKGEAVWENVTGCARRCATFNTFHISRRK